MLEIVNILTNAIGTGELVNIIYHGGSEPGKSRLILPLAMKSDRVRAKCHKSNRVKEFFLNKITLAPDNEPEYTGEQKKPGYGAIDDITTIAELAAKYKTELESYGWVVVSDDNSIGLYKRYKNGKTYKRPTHIIDLDADNFPERPWYCNSHRYKYLGKAAAVLLGLAKVP